MRDPYTTGFWASLVFLSDSFYEHHTQKTLETQLCNGLYVTILYVVKAIWANGAT